MPSPTLEPSVLNEAAAEPKLVADQVYARLSDAIFSGELPAGSRLRVRDLAEMVGTSVMGSERGSWSREPTAPRQVPPTRY